MNIKKARKLKQGEPIFHLETGEVGMVTWPIKTRGSMIFVELIDPLGRFQVWPYNKVERM